MPNVLNPARRALYGEEIGAVPADFVHIETISARSELHDWTISPHSHAGIFQVVLVLEGRARMLTDGREEELAPPCIAAMPGGALHGFGFLPGTRGWVLSLAETLLLDERFRALGIGRLAWEGAAVVFPLADRSQQAALLEAVLATLAERPAPAQSARVLATLGLLFASLEELLATPAVAAGRRTALVRRFASLIEAHYREHWPVTRYAAALGVTTPTLTRACRAAHGRAPGEMVLDRLLVEAMRGLAGSGAGIAELSEELGFADPAYFARFFKARAGVTASAFRRERAGLRA